MATIMECDRCGTTDPHPGSVNRVQHVVIEMSDVDINKDLCTSCRGQLKRFLERLPKEG